MRACLLLVSVVVVVAAVLVTPAARSQEAGHPIAFASSRLELITASGRHRFAVELAETDDQRSRGLMFRPFLAADAGMLFIYPDDRIISMWMKNTLIPLDMVFISADGRVVSVHERAVPHSLRPITSGVPARAVLELAGGSASRLGIRAGDRVVNDRLGSAR